MRLTISLLALILLGFLAGEVITGIGLPELRVVRDLARQRTSGLTDAAHVLSVLGRSYVLAAEALVCCLLFWRRGARAEAALLAASLAGTEVMWWIDKLLVGRARPPVAHLETVTSTSFPSGHATQTTAFYVALLIAVGSRARSKALISLLTVATAVMILGVSVSRVYLGVHYPSDVIAGVLLGGGWSVLVARSLGLLPRPSVGAR